MYFIILRLSSCKLTKKSCPSSGFCSRVQSHCSERTGPEFQWPWRQRGEKSLLWAEELAEDTKVLLCLYSINSIKNQYNWYMAVPLTCIFFLDWSFVDSEETAVQPLLLLLSQTHHILRSWTWAAITSEMRPQPGLWVYCLTVGWRLSGLFYLFIKKIQWRFDEYWYGS